MEFKKVSEEGDLKSSPDSTLHKLPTHGPKTVEMKWENEKGRLLGDQGDYDGLQCFAGCK